MAFTLPIFTKFTNAQQYMCTSVILNFTQIRQWMWKVHTHL